MKVATIYGKEWGDTYSEGRFPVCTTGTLEIYDTDSEIKIERRFDRGVYINGNMVWIGLLSQPGYFCARFDVMEVVRE